MDVKLILLWMILLIYPVFVKMSCHETKLPRDCESLCSKNRRGFISCELRAAVLLPDDDKTFDISLHKVLPVLGKTIFIKLHFKKKKLTTT